MLVATGSVRSMAPVQQLLVPVAPPPDTCETAQKLIAVALEFVMGTGAPTRHPGAEHFRLLPVLVDVVGPSVAPHPPPRPVICVTSTLWSGRRCGSGAELPPPPR